MSTRIRIMVQVDLDVDGDPGAALGLLDNVLDAGDFQDAINDWDDDECDVRVASIVVLPEYTELAESAEETSPS